MEFLTEIKDVIVAVAVGAWGVIGPVVQLLVPEEPTSQAFVLGVLATLGVMKRREIADLMEKHIPLVGLFGALIVRKVSDGAEFVLGKVRDFGLLIKANTWDRVAGWVSSATSWVKEKLSRK